MGWMLLRCLRCRPCWRMSSERGLFSFWGAWLLCGGCAPRPLVGVVVSFGSVMCCGGEVE